MSGRQNDVTRTCGAAGSPVGAATLGGVPDDFLIARNPDPDSSLPYLLRVPLGPDGILLKAKDTWPRTSKVYCHRAEEWPAEPDLVERVPVRSCVRRGAAIDLVLDRGRENRSQLVLTQVRGRQVVFWQSARTAKQARPAVAVPSARAAGLVDLEVVVDSHERYPYRFTDQQVTTTRAALPAGDYGVLHHGRPHAVVERKSIGDLASSLTSGRLRYQLADLAQLPRAAVVVEDRWSEVFRQRHVRPAVLADGIAECQVRWPSVPIVFCESRKLAQEWTYRFLAAALTHVEADAGAEAFLDGLVPGTPVPPAEPTAADVRAWAAAQSIEVAAKGRIPGTLRAAYDDAHRGGAGA